MTGALLLAAALLTSYGGFACLALAMPDHWAQAGGRTGDAPPRRLRFIGFLMLGTAYALCIFRDGPSFGSLLWGVSVSAAAIAVAFTLTWRPGVLLLKGRRPPLRKREDDLG